MRPENPYAAIAAKATRLGHRVSGLNIEGVKDENSDVGLAWFDCQRCRGTFTINMLKTDAGWIMDGPMVGAPVDERKRYTDSVNVVDNRCSPVLS